jgi:regulator of protease activity HflC (stomatin/prohibitin superfamily)
VVVPPRGGFFLPKFLIVSGRFINNLSIMELFETLAMFTPLWIALGVLIVASIKEVKEYERGVKFTFGKFSKVASPGWRIILPVFQRLVKIDLRVKAVDVPDQEAITEDNVSVTINAVIYYKVADASKAVLEVENFYYAISQLAQTTMRNAVGEVDLDTLLQKREQIAETIQKIVDAATDPWGIKVEAVELKDVVLSQDLKRTMAKVAEAERERRAVIIKAEGEVQASDNLSKAAKTLSESPGALHLRTLQSVNDLSSDQSNTTIWMMPLEILRAVEKIGDNLGKK